MDGSYLFCRFHHKQHKTPVVPAHFSLHSIDSTMAIRVCFILALLIFSFSFLQVAVGEVDSAEGEVGDLGIVNDDVQDVIGGTYTAASGVHTVCVFPKNPSKIVVGGQDSELLVGVKNEGESSLHIVAIQASIHLPFDHRYLVQNLSVQAFENAVVPPSSQATFPYAFAVSKFLQAGAFDFVGTIVYEIDQTPYQSTFYNGTIEVTEASGPLTIETVFLVGLAVAVIGFLFYWARNQIQNISKKSKRASKVEVGTSTIDASNDEWLQGTAYAQSLASKSKKKK